eukprot:TRINITY_DN39697_c0_g1_i1.p1 TRINITY_DN39697_c0_g1~~TRINITY_DN39697_c0_g1_i1.p1  ORF type:complete len:615 (-),score=50.83 TRINITY_DN39697_c0_g1_i1:387-2231(-)
MERNAVSIASQWRATLCPPVWANDGCTSDVRVPQLIQGFEQLVLPQTLYVALRLYQSVFRFEHDTVRGGAGPRLLEVYRQLEHLRQLGCMLRYRGCWTRRSRAEPSPVLRWRAGVRHLCRGATSTKYSTGRLFELQALCARMLSIRLGSTPRSRGPFLWGATVAKGLSVAVHMLASTVLPLDDPDVTGGQPGSSVLDVVRKAILTLERLDAVSQQQPAEVYSMRFDMLYPTHLTPGGVCASTAAASEIIAEPSVRWFRPELDGTRFHGPFPSVVTLLARLELSGLTLAKWVLNIGAGDGRCEGGDEYDPANCLVNKHGFRGVLIEADPENAQSAKERVAELSLRAEVFEGAVAPENISSIAWRSAQALFADEVDALEPLTQLAVLRRMQRPDLLKVDVDHADCALVARLLDTFEPLLLHVEINPLFPPPFSYAEKWQGRDSSLPVETAHHLIGCSLQAFADATRKQWRRGPRLMPYRLHHVEFENAVFVHPDVASVLHEDPPGFEGLASPPAKDAVLRSESEVQDSQKDMLDRYIVGYFCHPLRGVLSLREVLAGYDFRSWLDPRMSRQAVQAQMDSFLRRSWTMHSGWTGHANQTQAEDLPYALHVSPAGLKP